MRLQIVAAPNVADRGLADLLVLGHQTTTPVGHPFGLGLQRRSDDGFDLLRSERGLAASPRRHFPQTIDPFPGKASPP